VVEGIWRLCLGRLKRPNGGHLIGAQWGNGQQGDDGHGDGFADGVEKLNHGTVSAVVLCGGEKASGGDSPGRKSSSGASSAPAWPLGYTTL